MIGTDDKVPVGTILNQRWRVNEYIGGGAFGKVYKCESLKNQYPYELCVKIISLGREIKNKKKQKEQENIANSLNYEYDLMVGHFSNWPMKPFTPDKFYDVDEILGVRYLVMEKLDTDLLTYCKENELTPSEIGEIGLQIIRGIQWIHDRGLLYIDFKPENFMLKYESNNKYKIYFIDYGCSEIPTASRAPGRPVIGTPTYQSLNCHNGNLNWFKDEVESICLVLLSLLSEGKLPWSNATSPEDLKSIFSSTNMSELCHKVNLDEIGNIIAHCRTVKNSQKPNYFYCEEELTKLIQKKNGNNNKNNKNNKNKAVTSSNTSKNGKVPSVTADAPVIVSGGASIKAKSKSVPSKTESKKRAIVETVELLDDGESYVSPVRHSARHRLSDSSFHEEDINCKFTLQVIAGPHKSKSYEFKGQPNNEYTKKIMGKTGDISLDKEAAACNNHCTLFWTWGVDGELELNIKDGGIGITHVNGNKLTPKKWLVLKHHDIIKIGSTDIKVVVHK